MLTAASSGLRTSAESATALARQVGQFPSRGRVPAGVGDPRSDKARQGGRQHPGMPVGPESADGVLQGSQAAGVILGERDGPVDGLPHLVGQVGVACPVAGFYRHAAEPRQPLLHHLPLPGGFLLGDQLRSRQIHRRPPARVEQRGLGIRGPPGLRYRCGSDEPGQRSGDVR